MKLWLVRHAQPLIEPGVCYGATDVAADAPATAQAAMALAERLPHGVPVISSPLQRCQYLAQRLGALRPDLCVRTDARLSEMDFGSWEGQRWDALPKAEFDDWLAAFGSHRVGGAESLHQFMLRVADAWDEGRHAGRDAVWITHAGVIRAATLLAQGVRQVDQAAHWPHEVTAFGHWREIELP